MSSLIWPYISIFGSALYDTRNAYYRKRILVSLVVKLDSWGLLVRDFLESFPNMRADISAPHEQVASGCQFLLLLPVRRCL